MPSGGSLHAKDLCSSKHVAEGNKCNLTGMCAVFVFSFLITQHIALCSVFWEQHLQKQGNDDIGASHRAGASNLHGSY